MKIYQTLETQLKREPNFVTDNGELKKWVVISKAQNFDAELLALIMGHEELKAKFFVQVNDAWVFNQNLFVQFLEQKNYLNDSYTQYKNKVGLNVDGKYLKQRNEVALVWPFKDCILEGGQSREEDKREEIFFNEILAQDEITQLLEPKVFSNAKRFDADGEHSLDTFHRNEHDTITDNLIIKGNNLLALHSLQEEFAGKVKLIYIDPPYNTGSDSFKYNDSFNESTWLTFMKNRLDNSFKLMSQNGSIFVSIDHNELGNLLLLMNSIFGKNNLKNIITIKRGSVTGHKTINQGVVNLSEYLVVYAKNSAKWAPNRIFAERERNERYNNFILNRNMPMSNWKFCSLLDAFSESLNIEKSKLKKSLGEDFEHKIFEFIIKHSNAVIQFAYPDETKVSAEVKQQIIISKTTPNKVFHIARDNDPDIYLINGQRILFYSDRLIKVEEKWVTGELISDIWLDVLPNDLHNEGGVKLKKGKKPEKLIQRIFELATDADDLVLDFHLGSGTTAAVAHKMGRQYIGIEQMDYGQNDSFKRLQNVINGDSTGISKSVNWQGGGSFVYMEMKKYNQSFIELIEDAKDSDALLKVWEQMKEKSFLNYNVDIQKQEAHIEEFNALNLDEQKRHLCELLDKNQLYVNRSSLDDQEFACTDAEKTVTRNFYSKGFQ